MKNVLSVALICFLIGFCSCNGQKPSKKEITKIIENSEIEIEKGNYKTASELLDKVEKWDNKNGYVYAMRSKIAYFESDYEKALKLAEKAMTIMPENAELFCLKGEIFLKIGNLDSALDKCLRCVKNEKNENSYFSLAMAYKYNQNYILALKSLDSSIKFVDNYEVHYQKSDIYMYIKEYQMAIEECNKALRFNNNDGKSYLRRGIAYFKLGDISKCCEDVHRSLPILEDETNIIEAKSILEKYCK